MTPKRADEETVLSSHGHWRPAKPYRYANRSETQNAMPGGRGTSGPSRTDRKPVCPIISYGNFLLFLGGR
jgi:hypothetical protein